MEEIIEKNKRHIYNILFNNSIKFIYNHLQNNKKINISEILYIISNARYNIELLLSKLFPTLDLDINLSKFGRIRSRIGSHGRAYLNIEIKKYYYIPFEFLIDENYYETLFTPIYIKYKNYDDKIKRICLDNDKFIKSPNSYCFHYDTNIYDKKNTKSLSKTEPVFCLLHKFQNIGFGIHYKHIELTSFYYELNNKLYDELKNIPMNNRYLSNDINMYRAIYHTNPKNHMDILNVINKKFTELINNVNNPTYKYELELYNKNVILIKEIYWLLSHATLYERGSCAITEILCNSLFIFINVNYKNKIFINKKNINTDIEAMITPNIEEFVNSFDKFVNYNTIDNIEIFNDIDFSKYIESKNNLLDYNNNIEELDIYTFFNILDNNLDGNLKLIDIKDTNIQQPIINDVINDIINEFDI